MSAILTLVLSAHFGFAPLLLDARVRTLPTPDVLFVCLGWRGADTSDSGLRNVEPEGVDCRPPARLSVFTRRFSKGSYMVRAWVEGVNRHVLAHTLDQPLSVAAAAGDPQG